MTLDEMWKLWRSGRADMADAILAALARDVRYVACLLAKQWGNKGVIDRDDLCSTGNLAVLEAMPRFDPSIGASLKTYLLARARFEMLDHCREVDPLSRTHRQRLRQSGEDFKLERVDSEKCRAMAAPADTSVEDRDAFECWLRGLNDRERTILRARFIDEQSLPEIGLRLGLSGSRRVSVRSSPPASPGFAARPEDDTMDTLIPVTIGCLAFGFVLSAALLVRVAVGRVMRRQPSGQPEWREYRC